MAQTDAAGQPADELLATPSQPHRNATRALLLDIAAAGDRLVAVGERGVVLYSDDAGGNWTQAQVPVSVTLTAVTFPTTGRGWIVGHGGVILHSDDGGESWRAQRQGFRAPEPKDVDSAPRPDRPFLAVWFADANTGIAVGGYGLVMRTDDGGRTWQSLDDRLENPYGWHLNAVAAVGDSVFIAGERGHIHRSDDRGRSWTEIASPYDGSYFGITALDGGKLVAHGLEGRVHLSEDRGRSWRRMPAPLEAAATDVARLPDGRQALVANSGAVLCRPAGGERFRVIRAKGRPLVAVAPVNGGAALIAAGVGGISRIDLGPGC